MDARLPYAERVNDLPAYSCTEAGHFLCIPVTTVRAWIRGQPYMTKAGEKLFRRVIIPADEKTGYLSFRNLIELYVLSSIRKTYNVPLKKVRSAIERVRDTFGTLHPLSNLDILTDQSDLFVERFGEYLNISSHGQIEIKTALKECLKRIEKDAKGIPKKLFAYGEHVAIDPLLNFGRPSIVGPGIATEVVYERHSSGESVDFLSNDYKCDKILIQEAIEYESSCRDRAA